MPLVPTYTVVNSAGISQSVIDLLLGLADEAFRLWGEVLAGDAQLSVRIELLENTSSGRAQGGWGNGTNIGQLGGVNVIVGAPAYELQTGTNVNGGQGDVVVQFSADYLLNELFLDPTPATRDDIPSNRTDGLSVLLHEIGHALGFIGYYNTDTNVQGSFASVYDLRRIDVGDQDFFSGPNVLALLGGALELTNGNYAHYGNSSAFPGAGDDPLTGLMNGVVFYRGYAYTIGDLDLAVLADTGLGTIRDDVLDNPLHTHLRGGAGNDQIIGGDINNVFFGDEGFDQLFGGGGNDELNGGDDPDWLTGGLGNDTIDGGESVDTAVVSGNRASYTVTQTSTGVWQVVGADGTDTLTNVEYLQFNDELLRLRPGSGIAVSFDPGNAASYQAAMENIRDFSGIDLGGDGAWIWIGATDINGDGDVDQVLVNAEIGRFATVDTAPDGLVYFNDHGWAGETRVAGIYIDPLVLSGDAELGGPFDSQTRFQNDLFIGNIGRVLGAGDYDGDGLQEVYFALTDGTAYLHAYMHADGNIRYANYQNQQQVIEFLESYGYGEETYGDWFTGGSGQEEPASGKPAGITDPVFDPFASGKQDDGAGSGGAGDGFGRNFGSHGASAPGILLAGEIALASASFLDQHLQAEFYG